MQARLGVPPVDAQRLIIFRLALRAEGRYRADVFVRSGRTFHRVVAGIHLGLDGLPAPRLTIVGEVFIASSFSGDCG